MTIILHGYISAYGFVPMSLSVWSFATYVVEIVAMWIATDLLLGGPIRLKGGKEEVSSHSVPLIKARQG